MTRIKAILVSLVVCFVVSPPEAGQAQGLESSSWFVRAGMTPNYVLPTNPFPPKANGTGEPVRWGENLTFEIGRQTDGSKDWHYRYKMPSYGFGLSISSFPTAVESGRPVDAY